MDIHVQSYNTDLYKGIVIDMGTKLYNSLSGYIKEIESVHSGTYIYRLNNLLGIYSWSNKLIY